VFVVLVPPFVYRAALATSRRDFRDHLRSIVLLAIGLVLMTILAIASRRREFFLRERRQTPSRRPRPPSASTCSTPNARRARLATRKRRTEERGFDNVQGVQ